jgi:membrane protein YqaA with SNARE-associated domain
MLEHSFLFLSAFLAATILPFYSEVVLFTYLQQGLNPVTLVIAAAVGNTLGSAVNWALGIYIQRFKDRRWFYFSEKQMLRAQDQFQHYGSWTLLLAWLPIGGDALTLIAGVMRVRFGLFLLLVGIGKTGRYVAIVALNGWFG